jgi:hypothetical protein
MFCAGQHNDSRPTTGCNGITGNGIYAALAHGFPEREDLRNGTRHLLEGQLQVKEG